MRPHEIKDHPDADLSLQLAHLWRHSKEFGARAIVPVVARSDSHHSSPDSSTPLRGAEAGVL